MLQNVKDQMRHNNRHSPRPRSTRKTKEPDSLSSLPQAVFSKTLKEQFNACISHSVELTSSDDVLS